MTKLLVGIAKENYKLSDQTDFYGMGPHSAVMSNSGNFSSHSNLPSNVEQDFPPSSQRFVSTRYLDNYTPTHAIAIGSSTYSRAVPERQRSLDIVPKHNIYESFKDERKRLQTFTNWPTSAPVKKEDLARNGFIYLDVQDRTQCVFCRGILSKWEVGDIVEDEHKRNCPECPLAFGYECGNRPVVSQVQTETCFNQQPASQPTFNTTVKIPSQATNTYPYACHIIRNVGGEDEVGHHPNTQDVVPGNCADAIGNVSSGLPSIPAQQQSLSGRQTSTIAPKYPQWADENLRIQSFVGWPAQMSQKPRDLAHAGLLYMGTATGDRCKCFWCGGELFAWEPQDDPMEEHAKWFSHCNYVKNLKGEAYIQYVKDKQNGLIVEPSELMSKPHVLAVLHAGYTHEQIEEAVRRYGATTLLSANEIMQAIESINRERQTRLQQMNLHNSLQHAPQPQTVPLATGDTDDENNESMEIEDFELEPPEQTNVKSQDTSVGQDSLKSTAGLQKLSTAAASSSKSVDRDVDTVLLENEKLKDQKLCKICMDKDLCVTFLPCSHLVTCEECSNSVRECPVCRKEIQQRVKVYWS